MHRTYYPEVLMTNVIPQPKRVGGEVESFSLMTSDRQVRAVKRQALALNPPKRSYNYEPSVLERIADYIPRILSSTEVRHERLTTMGLTRLAAAEKTALRVELTGLSYTELTGEELEMWQKFLPTHYHVRDFAYDSIPEKALDELETAQGMGCFDSIAIWTPEHNDLKGRLQQRASNIRRSIGSALQRSLDPLAVGMIEDHNGTQHFYAIVRWAESLEPVETIKAYVEKVDRQERHTLLAIPVILVITFALLAIPMQLFVLIPIIILALVVGVIAIVRWMET